MTTSNVALLEDSSELEDTSELDETTELDDSSDELLSSELELTELEDTLEEEMLEDEATELLEAGSGKPSQRTSSISKVPASPVWPVICQLKAFALARASATLTVTSVHVG